MPPNPWLRFRVPLGFLFAGGYLWLTQYVHIDRLGVAVVLIVLGCSLRSWAAGYLFKGKRVAVGGPYAYVRNPLYMGSFLIGLGFCWALYWKPWPVVCLWTLYLVGFGLLYASKALAEEKELLDNLGADYAAYRARVPAFLPLRGRVSDLGDQHFSSELYRKNREYQCILGSAALLAILCWRALYGV